MDEQLKGEIAQLKAKIGDARKAADGDQVKRAIDLLYEAREAAESIPSKEAEVRHVRCLIYSDLALMLQRVQDPARSISFYLQAEEEAAALPLDEELNYRLQYATVLVNLAGLFAQQRLFDDGLARVSRALELIGQSADPAGPMIRVLEHGALQNKAAIHLEMRDIDAAGQALEAAVEVGTKLLADGQAHFTPQVVEATGRLVAVLRAQGRTPEALPWAERAGRWADAAFEAGAVFGPALFVNTHMMLADVHLQLGDYAEAENHIGRAVDGLEDLAARQPQAAGMATSTMLSATGFYFALLRQDADKLESGGLPRDEVVEAVDDLIRRLVARNLPADLLELTRARHQVLVRELLEGPQSVVTRHSSRTTDVQPAVRQILPQLQGDIDWQRDRLAARGGSSKGGAT